MKTSFIPSSRHRKFRCKTRRRVLLAQSWWLDQVLTGVARYARDHDWILDCDMHWTHWPPYTTDWHGDGIIVYAAVSRSVPVLIDFVRNAKACIVDLQSFGDYFGAPKVNISHQETGRMAASHLLSLGFQHLGYVEFHNNPIEWARREGFEARVREAGQHFHFIQLQNLSLRKLSRQLPLLPKPLGLMAMNDSNAFKVTRACLDQGLHIPEEVAVIGADNTAILCDLAPVPLTSVDSDHERQGYEAAVLLDRLMNGKAPPAEPIIIPPKGVVVRRSTDTIAFPDPAAVTALRFLRDHYREPISIQHLAPIIPGALRRVQKLFPKHAGRTMAQELTRLRVEYVKKLLADRDRKIEAIAVESGFTNRFHLQRAFQRVTGQTPKDYRDSLTPGPG